MNENTNDQELRAAASEADEQSLDLDVEALFASTASEIKTHDASFRGRFRSQPTWIRRTIALTALFLIVALAGPLSPRPDLADYPPLRMVIHVVSLLGLGSLCLWTALRPLYVPAWSGAKLWSAVFFVTACTLGLCMLPELPSQVEGPGLPCLMMGIAVALPVFLVIRLVDRGALLSAVLAGAAGGLAGNVALQLHCPINTQSHLLSGHFPVIVVLVVLATGYGFWSRART